MVRKYAILFVLLSVALSLSGFASPLAAAAEEGGNPWWIWILVFLALVAFVAFMLWWWLRGEEEEEEEEAVSPAGPEPVAAVHVVEEVEEAKVSLAPPQPDDLKVVEGIGPKISGVLQAAGITTFAQLAATDVGRLKQILEEESPTLLRLADPTTWPEQARLAAGGEWEALEKLQDELKGGRRAG